MSRRRVAEIGAGVWATGGAAMAISSLANANDDARVLVWSASVVFPLCALAAAWALRHHRDRMAGLLLVASVATPTYFAYPLNILALVVGLALLVRPSVVLGERRSVASVAQ